MYDLTLFIHSIFPLIALILLIIGIKNKGIFYIISSLWLSLIAIVIHFQRSGGEILGSYFNYTNAAVYSINLIILVISLVLVINHLSNNSSELKYSASLIQSLLVIGSILVIINLTINACFMENRMKGTPIMQVALLDKPEYCSYRYLFYKVTPNGTVEYLCPNHYGFVPSIGHLDISPDFIATQLSSPSKKQMLLLQKKKTKD